MPGPPGTGGLLAEHGELRIGAGHLDRAPLPLPGLTSAPVTLVLSHRCDGGWRRHRVIAGHLGGM